MLSAIEIDVLQREHGKLHRYFIWPIFSPNITARYEMIPKPHEDADSLLHRLARCYGDKPLTFIVKQMGHSSVKEIYQIYGDWINDHTTNRLNRLNKNRSMCSQYAP